MKIAMLGHRKFPSREGGVEVVVEELSTRLVKLGHNVTVYNRTDKKENRKASSYKGVNIKKVITIQGKGIAAATSSLFATFKILFSDAEVVHYHAEGPCYWMWILKWFSKKRIIATIHGLNWKSPKWKGFGEKYIKAGERKAVKYADEIIVLSENIKKYFKDTYNRKTVYIPNGIDKPEQKEASIIKEKWGLNKDDYILYLGRLVPEKGAHYLIEAYKNTDTKKKLVIAGMPSDTHKYYNLLKEMSDNSKKVIFTGFVQGQELQELYSNAYIYCLPSDSEGMPMGLLEAMAYGNCCVTSDIKECTEVIENNKLVFKKSDAQELAKILQSLCDNPSLVQWYQQTSQNYILERYSWDDVVNRTLNLYTGRK